MVNNFLENIDLLNKTYNIHKDSHIKSSQIKNFASNVKMSKCKKNDLYGMFLPDEHLKYIYGIYQGRIVEKTEDFDFKYYFDENGRLLFTERYSESKLINKIIYFYYEQKIEVIWYDSKTDQIINVSIIEYRDTLFHRFLTGDFNTNILSFDEYRFEIIDNQLVMNRKGYLLNPFDSNKIVDKINVKELIYIKK